MKSRKRTIRTQLTEEKIDDIVEAQAGDDSAWEKPIKVGKAKAGSVTLPAELAARVEFLAELHREKNAGDWLTKVIKERVELEEVAFTQAKREMSLRNGA